MKRIRIARSRSPSRTFHRRLQGFQGLLGMWKSAMGAQRRIDLDEEKILLSQQKRKINELEEGIRANRLVLLDIQIEQKQLELRALKRKLGDPDDFADPMTER